MLHRGVFCHVKAEATRTSTSSCNVAQLLRKIHLTRHITAPTRSLHCGQIRRTGIAFLSRTYATATTAASEVKPTKTVQSAVKEAAKKPASTRGPYKKKTSAEKTSTRKNPAKKGSTAKPSARKTAVKKKTAAKKRPEPKEVLTDEQTATKQARALLKAQFMTRKQLRERAMLKGEPKVPSLSAWNVFQSEGPMKEPGKDSNPRTLMGERAKTGAEQYKNLTPAEREHYNHLANERKAAMEAEYKTWVESHTPDRIRIANNARRHILRLRAAMSAEAKGLSHTRIIKDERQLKRPISAFTLFHIERFASNDFKGIPHVADAARLSAEEWKALSEGEKKKYHDAAAANLEHYQQEYKALYGHEAPSRLRKPSAPAVATAE
ncbi:hypothetical protein B0A49_02351 [Cryomyces minteri]|uniref:HMG box domain-containing protein n=1 Tax=Cryomyces minteri TaxID=331657 RepID=A0A4U0XPG5_9PEZI|nr:hypothetical protein B0A49_02351 [Cryomyces minteri]